jgi:outer membrane protein assembly factor BamE (lipoprotein component of BamABCDE complex)
LYLYVVVFVGVPRAEPSSWKGVTMQAAELIRKGLILLAALACGCMSAAQHQQDLGSSKEIRVGMSQADVASALGSPNIVTKDGEGKETWVYDKIATEASYSQSGVGLGGGVGAGGVAGSALILGGVGGSYGKGAGATATTQKTLTVVIKFDKNTSLVESFSYHTSKF